MTAAKVLDIDRRAKKLPRDVQLGTFFERNVPVASMFIDVRTEGGGYARPLSEKRAAKLAAEFDRRAVGVLLLSMRDDGRYAIIDGQHRADAALRAGVTELDAYVYIDLTIEDEARLYRQFGDYLKQSARDRYFAAIAERQPEALAIERLLKEYGLRVTNDSGQQHGVAAVGAIWRVSETWGPHILRETFSLLVDAFDGDPLALVGPSIVGAAMFLDRFMTNPAYSRKRLITRLQRAGAAKLEQNALHVVALEHCSKMGAYGKALLAMHDNGAKPENRLGEWPEHSLTPAHVEKLRVNIKKASDAWLQKRKEGAINRASEIRCPVCGAGVGKRCHDTDYVHMRRLRDAAEKRRAQAARA